MIYTLATITGFTSLFLIMVFTSLLGIEDQIPPEAGRNEKLIDFTLKWLPRLYVSGIVSLIVAAISAGRF